MDKSLVPVALATGNAAAITLFLKLFFPVGGFTFLGLVILTFLLLCFFRATGRSD